MTLAQTRLSNPFQSSVGPAKTAAPGSTSRGLCTLSYGNRVFRFRTNPNQVWWTYELITHVDETYGGRVIQLLGTRLGDLTIKVECGAGGWDELMRMVMFLRDLLVDQRNGNTALFEYTTRNWKLHVYGLTIPFQDEITATTRELEITFKIQEDVSGVVSRASLNTEIARLREGIYRPTDNIHNQYNDKDKGGVPLNILGSSIPTIPYAPSGLTNTVDTSPLGNNPGGLNPLGGILSPGGGGILGGLLGGLNIPGLGSLNIPGLGGK